MRRLVLAPLVAFAALGAAFATLGAAGVPAAMADPGQGVVSATIYGGSSGVSTQTVTLGTLDGCPLYSGSSPMYLYPGDQPYSPASSSSWALSTVVQCGLGQPLSDVTNVQVESPAHGFEAPLSSAELSDPSQFHDPAAPDALPVISVDGNENQNTYVRPWLGGSDDNAGDQVIVDGAPITIAVYENGPPLTVKPSQWTISTSAAKMTVDLKATVQKSGGTTIPASSLSWSWNFADGTGSSAAAPRHSFAPGLYPVTVQVSDQSAGTGGTATIEVNFSPSSSSGSGNRTGAGHSKKGKAPTGPVHSSGNHPAAAAGSSNQGSSTTGQHASGGASAPAPTTAAAGPSAAQPAKPASANHSPRRSGRAGARAHASDALRTPLPSGPVVVGQLISDVTPLPPSASPLLRQVPAAVASAPPVRGAVHSSILPALGAALVALALFGLGAARESRAKLPWGRLRSRA